MAQECERSVHVDALVETYEGTVPLLICSVDGGPRQALTPKQVDALGADSGELIAMMRGAGDRAAAEIRSFQDPE